jgi:hypothetical protein
MLPVIPGLRYVPDSLDLETHERLLAAADAGEWRYLGERRVQAHGYSYDTWDGREWPRGRRVSLTFRTMRARSWYG